MLFSCSNDIEEIKALTEDKKIASQTILQGTFFYTENGRLLNKLEAAKLDRYEGEEGYLDVSGGFTLTMYDSAEQVEATLKAQSGIFYELENKLEARENVILENREGSKLNTEELIWMQDSDKVYTDKYVTITTPDATIHGKGLVSDTRFRKRQIKQVTGKIKVDDPSKQETDNGLPKSN
jgi:LPS export ABC transporter protein LptC